MVQSYLFQFCPKTLQAIGYLYGCLLHCPFKRQKNIIRSMTEPDHYSLYRKLRVAVKNDDDLFNVRYTLADDRHQADTDVHQQQTSRERVAKIVRPAEVKNLQYNSKHRKGSVDLKDTPKPRPHHKHEQKWKQREREAGEGREGQVKRESKQEKAEQADLSEDNEAEERTESIGKVQLRKSEENYEMIEKLVDDDSDTFEGLAQPQLKSKRSKSSEFKEAFEGMQLARGSQVSIKDPRRLYDEYLDVKVIEESRVKGERIYYRGTVQFSDTVKWYCNIQSGQVQGVLVVEGRNTNRALHEDEVYFIIVAELKEKVLCKVVAIASRRVREVVGKIEFHKAKQIYLLRPTNAKFASMNIDLTQIDKQCLQHACSKYFLAEFAYWDPTDDHPFCKIKGEYGTFGQVEIETQAILKTYSIEEPHYTEFQLEAFFAPFKNSVDGFGEFTPSSEELKRRKDFRKWRTFIVRDCEFDAAFSIFPVNVRGKADPNFLKRNLYEVSVHFTDVSYFVGEGSAVDLQARRRVAGYNLVHRMISMLPEPFNSIFCALRAKHESLTISISFQIDEEGNVQEVSKVARSIINPPFAFSYEQLERVLAGDVAAEVWRGWDCGCRMESEYKAISGDIRLLHQLISKRRQLRIDSGGLAFQIPVKSFRLAQNLTPTYFELRGKGEAHHMIEECVVTSSTKAAQFLLKNHKGKAILYRHRFPGFKRLDKFKRTLKKTGQSLPENQKEIQKFVNEIVTGGQLKQCLRDVIKYQTVKLLENFDYFQGLNSDPATWVHYAINLPLYTHCATPTRNYADLLVQRQLTAAIDGLPWTVPETETTALLENCTRGKQIAQHIQNSCEKVFLCLYLRENPVFTSAVLTDIEEWGLKICIPRFNFKTMMKFKQLKTVKAGKVGTDENSRRFVRLDFTSDTAGFKTKLVLREMQEINLQIRSADTYPLDYGFSIVLPHPTDPTQKILIS